jgi:hypothetical protein
MPASSEQYRRILWFNPFLDRYEDAVAEREVMVPCEPRLPGLEAVEANLVSSRLAFDDKEDVFGKWHSPVLDIDFEAQLVPSSTPGHYHLYLDGLRLQWSAYKKLLAALAEAGVIQEGYYENSVRRQMTCVRPPHVRKVVETT